MKIEEAIELLEILAKELDIPQRASMRYATKLGIEALKLIHLNQELFGETEAFKLTGEDE